MSKADLRGHRKPSSWVHFWACFHSKPGTHTEILNYQWARVDKTWPCPRITWDSLKNTFLRLHPAFIALASVVLGPRDLYVGKGPPGFWFCSSSEHWPAISSSWEHPGTLRWEILTCIVWFRQRCRSSQNQSIEFEVAGGGAPVLLWMRTVRSIYRAGVLPEKVVEV